MPGESSASFSIYMKFSVLMVPNISETLKPS